MAGTGDIQLSSNFELSSQRPLDARETQLNKVSIDGIAFVQRFDGLEVYDEGTKKSWQLILGTVDNDLNNNLNWVDKSLLSSYVNDLNFLVPGDNISLLTNDSGFISVESDPIFTASPASGITGLQISNWDTAFGWGNHALAGYLTSYTETDPVFTASAAFGITASNITNWNTAYTHSQVVTGNPHNVTAADVNLANLTAGNGISGSVYDGVLARTWNLSYGGSGGDFGVSNNVARSDHIHDALYDITYAKSSLTITDPSTIAKGITFNTSFVERMEFDAATGRNIVFLHIAFGYNTDTSIDQGSLLVTLGADFRPVATTRMNFTRVSASDNQTRALQGQVDTAGQVFIYYEDAATFTINADSFIQGTITYFTN
jgi:hypothetical protein